MEDGAAVKLALGNLNHAHLQESKWRRGQLMNVYTQENNSYSNSCEETTRTTFKRGHARLRVEFMHALLMPGDPFVQAVPKQPMGGVAATACS